MIRRFAIPKAVAFSQQFVVTLAGILCFLRKTRIFIDIFQKDFEESIESGIGKNTNSLLQNVDHLWLSGCPGN